MNIYRLYLGHVTESQASRRVLRTRGTVIAAIAVAAAAVVTVTLILTGGSPPRKPLTAAQAAHNRGIATGHALDVGRGTGVITKRPTLRLGLLAQAANPVGLAATRLGYLTVQLAASQTQLNSEPYTSPDAEESALASGRLDAAYITPVAAVQAWQHSHGGIRIIAGAATRAATTVSVLVVTASYLSAHPLQVQELLKGHVQTTTLFTTDAVASYADAAAELASLTHTGVSAHLTASLERGRASCDPGASSVLAQARAAAAAGQLQSVTSLSGAYDIALLNQLLEASGEAQVTT
jgi:hypothetical protein